MRPKATVSFYLFALFLFLPGCSFSLDGLRQYRAERAIERHDFAFALNILQKIMQSEPDSTRALVAAKLGAKVAHLDAKNYALAVEFYKHIVLRAKDAEERKAAQKNIAQIHFENLMDYDQAVLEYEKLLKLELRPEDAFRYRLNLAKSQLHMNNIDQAVSELDILLAQNHSPDEMFEAKIFKGNTLIAARRLPEAASVWQSILKDFPEKSQKENVALNLVVCYEEMKEFGRAIDVLEGMRPGYAHPDFLDLKIQRLKKRLGDQPGAQGLRR